MKLPNSFTGVAIALSVAATAGTAAAGPARTAVGPYLAVVDRTPYAKPALPAIGGAGSVITDPVFGSTIRRITDGNTRPGTPDRSYRTPSSPHQNAWSANGSYFYVVSGDGSVIPYAFDGSTGAARRLNATSSGAGGLVVNFYIEPQFSYVNDSIIYGSVAGGTLRTIDQYNFATGAYSQLLNLDTLASGLSGTYIGGVGSSAGATERIMAFFGGTSQDHHHLVVVFDKNNPSNRLVLDTIANTVNGQPTSTMLSFSLHHVAIDRSGRYVMLYPTSADQTGTRQAPQSVAWDTQTNVFTLMPVSTHPYGHDAFGYGVSVNQDCCTTTTWDAAQWQFRNLATPASSHDVLATVLSPKEVSLSDHTTWNNAAPDHLTPYVSGLFRYGTNTTSWRAWDDEIVAVQTDNAPGTNPTVWRFAHHRSDVTNDLDATRVSFWYEPRANISHDGRWVLFTSNWEKTLGTDPAGESGTGARQDVFLVALAAADGSTSTATTTGTITPTPAPAQTSRPVMWIDVPGANATLAQPFTLAGWAIDAGATTDAGVDIIDVWAYPNPGSNTAPRFVGSARYGGARPDLAGAFGSQFLNSGYSLSVSGLPSGVYQLAVFAHSRLTGTFNDVRTVTVNVTAAQPRMSVDIPGNNAAAATSFIVAGWAFDPNAASGSGVDAIHVWAYPNPGSGTAPRFVGAATVGYSRPDVASVFGPAGASSGYGLIASLATGVYDLVVFAHSTVTGTFNQSQVVRITVR
jgi:hypothetical protein